MKKLFYKCIGALLYAGGWLLVHGIMFLEEISEAAGEFVGGIGEAIGDLFRRK